MNYKELIRSAKEQGTTSEKKMWQSIEMISDLMEKIKTEHPGLYWQFMRNQYGLMHDCHYEQSMAQYDVSKLAMIDNDGIIHNGPFWTAEQIDEATSSMEFEPEVTRWDRYVAFNVAYSDFSKHMDDDHVLQAGYDFFFGDEDWKGSSKIWQYMQMKSTCQ